MSEDFQVTYIVVLHGHLCWVSQVALLFQFAQSFTTTTFKMIVKTWLLELNLWAGHWACVLSIPKPLIPFYKRLLFTHNNYFIVD